MRLITMVTSRSLMEWDSRKIHTMKIINSGKLIIQRKVAKEEGKFQIDETMIHLKIGINR